MTDKKTWNLPQDLVDKIYNEEVKACLERMKQRYEEAEALGEKGREIAALQAEAATISATLDPLLFDSSKNGAKIKESGKRLDAIAARIDELNGFRQHQVKTSQMIRSFGPDGRPFGAGVGPGDGSR
jgi:uncharacterized coiled-coil DUF342 family protein